MRHENACVQPGILNIIIYYYDRRKYETLSQPFTNVSITFILLNIDFWKLILEIAL